MSQSDPVRNDESKSLMVKVGENNIHIDLEPSILQMFEHIQTATGSGTSIEESFAEFMRQFKPKLEQQFQQAIFNDFQQVRLQQKVNQNGQMDLGEMENEDEISPEDTTSPNRL